MNAKQKTKLQQEVDEMIAYLTIWKINIARERKRLQNELSNIRI